MRAPPPLGVRWGAVQRLHRLLRTAAVLAMAGATAGCASDPVPQTPSTIPPAIVEVMQADKATTFVGEGRLSAAPEFVELRVRIEAECYRTPMAASKAADDAATAVSKTLRKALARPKGRDGVFSNGGYTRSFERHVNGARSCAGTFAKTVTIVAKTSQIDALQRDFATIQHELLAGALAPPAAGASRGATTYALLEEPQPALYYETRERLEQAALGDALANARAKLEATLTAGCGATDYQIVRMVESAPDKGRPIAYARSQPEREGTALALDAIWINKLLDVSFVVAPGHCAGAGANGRSKRRRDRL